MSSSPRRVVVVLTAVAALGSAACLQTAFAQRKVVTLPIIVNPQPPAAGSADAASFDLPKDTEARRRIEAARDYIEAKRWEEVVAALQRVLDDPQDKFAPLPRKGPDGKEVIVPTSVRAEANRLLAGLPKDGLEAYKVYKEAGPRADEYLKKAKDAPTVEERLALLGLIVRNYLHTDAGGEAADLLATHHMDRGDFRTAARFYALLLTRAGGADALPADVLFRAAYAFDQADDKANEEVVWQSAKSRGIREIRFGDDAKSVSDLQDYLAGLGHAADAFSRQWAYFLGDASHTGKGDGGPAFMRYDWATPTNVADPLESHVGSSTTFKEKIEALFKEASDRLTPTNQPILPPQFPVAVTVTLKSDGKKHSLVVFRTHSGIAACDMAERNGKMVGRAPIKGTLEWMMAEGRENTLNQWTQAYTGNPQQGGGQRPGILFENTTIGTLSTDGEFAYTVEDLAVPPPPAYRVQNMGFPPGGNPYGWPQDIVNAINHSRLMAYDLTAGCKTAWEAPEANDTTGELADSYFLGPPLCVNGKLYVLAEKQQELRLICLENVKGTAADGHPTIKPKIDFVLPLGTARDSRLQLDSLRRVNAAHLSYGEGVLVCPTNLGYVIAIDLLQNSLLWAYPYRDKADEDDNSALGMGGPGMGMAVIRGRMVGGLGGMPVIIGPNGQPIVQGPPQQGWKASAPIIQDGKVVFTAPDSKSIHCVRLKDGTPVWSRPRQEGDLYLGAVVNGKAIVVGTKVVRAYNLSNGEKPWEPVETGLPSGFGAASDNVYYVPLKEAYNTKEPEICGVDVDRGIAVVHSKARAPGVNEREITAPGNLVFFDGRVVSQTNEEVLAFPQLKVKIAEMTERLKANPNDSEGLFSRGELSLEEGNLEGAVGDFRQVIQGAPPAELQVKAKAKLYEALTEYFQHDFDKAQTYQDEYAALCGRDLPATATDQQRTEARQHRITYLYLLAKGKEGQRKLTEAFDLYLQLNAEAERKDGAASDELLSLVGEPQVKAAPDVLAQGRIAAMVANATEEERKPLEARIDAKWKEIQGKTDLPELRKFVTLFGSLFTVGQQARLRLAELLMDDKDGNALIDAERHLMLLRARTQDPELSARAVECLARLNTRKGLLEDAAYYYRLLRDRYPTVKVSDGKTGADLFDEIASDKRLWGELDEQPPFGAVGKLDAKEERGSFLPMNPVFKFGRAGEALPFFRRYDVGLNPSNNDLALIDRTAGDRDHAGNDPHSTSLKLDNKYNDFGAILAAGNTQMMNPNFFPPGMAGAAAQPPPSPKFSYMNLGHLMVLPVGRMVYGIDAVRWMVLWKKDLSQPVNGPAPASELGVPSVTVDPRDGSVQAVYSDGWTQRLGQTGPLEGAAVCLQMKDALTAVDPIDGHTLWTRSDVTSRGHIFGDDQYVFVVEMSSDNKPSYTRVFRAYDGSSVKAPDFREAYENRIRLVGRDLLVADKDKDATTLRLYDPLTGKDLWKQAFAAKSYVLQAEDGDLTGVVEPDGRVRVVDLATRKEMPEPDKKIDPKFLEKDAVMTVLGDADDVYIVPNDPVEATTRVNTNLMPATGLRGLNVNGALYAFRRDSGKMHWRAEAADQQLVLDQFQEMPVVLLTAHTMKFQGGFGGMQGQTTALQVIEKKTGKLLRENSNVPQGQFYSLEVDGRRGKIEFISPQDKVVVFPKDDKPTAAPPSAP